ncbi:MAG: hypothetical protein CUR32_01330 [Flavobacterium sp.]|nr:MAG: hypothetical protein CUR32_01330 [Flavobacterium sp.] [Flavobacterium sp. FEMGT703F]
MAKITTDKIGIDLKGRVNRLKLAERNMLLPLFEAIVNSIHAIEDTGNPKGTININLIRSSQTTVEFEGSHAIPEIIGFEIEDNGIGFNEENYESFKREYSTYKADKGGLGIGRFMWLKAFHNVTVESIYYEDSLPKNRSFSFNLRTPDGIENPQINSLEGKPEKKTTITLSGYKDPYKSKCPKKTETIANRIIEHCLIYFLNPSCPTITLIDGVDKLELNQYFEKITSGNRFTEKFFVSNKEFKITLLKWFSHEEFTSHRLSICANNREVDSFNINKVLPDVSGKIRDIVTGEYYLIVGYIEGKYFDENINDERTEVTFSKDSLLDIDLISIKDLYNELAPVIKKHFHEEVEKFKTQKLERITYFIAEKAPQYRILNKYIESFDDVTVTENTSEQELDLKLYRLLQDVEFTSRKDVVTALTEDDNNQTPDELKQKYLRIFEELTDLNKSKLAQYVVHRKYILELFEKSLGLNAQGKYELEDTVHSIIYPTKTTSNDIDYNNQNLWILDERLSFHTFLSSDKQIKKTPGIQSDSKDRPDLMIFNNPISYIEGDEAPFNSVTLVEFKRPMRKGYDDYEEDPIVQLFDYVREIKKGKKLTEGGRTYDINESTKFYCYLVCDINEKIIRFAENAQLEKTYDGLGYYGYNKSLRCVIDVMPFNQVLSNAKKRNKVLFNKLGI